MRFHYVLSALILLLCAAILSYDFFIVKQTDLISPQSRIEKLTRDIVANILPASTIPSPPLMPTPAPSPLPVDMVIDLINKERIGLGYSSLSQGKQTCTLLDIYFDQHELTDKIIANTCPTCQRVNIVSLPKQTSVEALRTYLNQQESVSFLINNKTYTHYCLRDDVDAYAVASVISATSENSPSVLPVVTKTISEDELWTALMDYRKANVVPDLSKDENLCVYARKRVEDHLQMIKTNQSKDTYPVPEKYPLDAHEGFQKDADSGYVFDITGKKVVAENLAYWPNAAYATHVIEWGWDTSTEGHRETQLSRDYNSGCLSGKEGFFVAIYGR